MSDEQQANDIARKTILYPAPAADAVTIRRDVVYGEVGAAMLTMDLYSPARATNCARQPAVIIVSGYPDPGFERVVGCRFKQMGSTVSWAMLIAASGLVAITYTNLEPVRDLATVLEYVTQHAEALGVDAGRLAVWASSGNVPVALGQLMTENRGAVTCAVLCYGYTLDLDGATAVAEAAASFRFANPCAGRRADDLPRDAALFIARAGKDEMPRLNEALDRFVARALERNLPVTLVNHPSAPHAFDLVHDCRETRAVIAQIVRFLQLNLSANGGGSTLPPNHSSEGVGQEE